MNMTSRKGRKERK